MLLTMRLSVPNYTPAPVLVAVMPVPHTTDKRQHRCEPKGAATKTAPPLITVPVLNVQHVSVERRMRPVGHAGRI